MKEKFGKTSKSQNIMTKTVVQMNIYNLGRNILRLFDVSTDFPLTTSETMCNYYLKTWYMRVAL